MDNCLEYMKYITNNIFKMQFLAQAL